MQGLKSHTDACSSIITSQRGLTVTPGELWAQIWEPGATGNTSTRALIPNQGLHEACNDRMNGCHLDAQA